ncbi:MAG: hypothetical protein NVSMB2_04900 [Chloroflexota bacterium]
MRLSQGQRIWERWLAAAGTWQGWSMCPLLVSPGIEDVEPHAPSHRLHERARHLREEVQLELAESGTCLLLDLDPVVGISIAGALCDEGVARPLLLLPRWPYCSAVLDAPQSLWALTEFAPHPVDHIRANVCIVIDAQRQTGDVAKKNKRGQVDNRYRLSALDFPSLNELRAREIRRILRLSYS